jgi:ribosomal protein S18 acetylase RimI-like enzyme
MSAAGHPLDAPIWEALRTTHASLSLGDELAKKYPREVSPLSGLREQSPEAYASLARLLEPNEPAVLFLTEPPRPPEGWKIIRHSGLEQRMCERLIEAARPEPEFVALGPADVPEMLALTKLTIPGPFSTRTIEFGGYIGVRENGRLLAMAGQRTRPAGFTEVSAVCTHPDARGRGYAEALIRSISRRIFARGEVPFLGVRPDNEAAKRVYERLGFRLRTTMELVAVARP